jgi:DNA-binding transcriptional MerR regulator
MTKPSSKTIPIATAAAAVPCSEQALRRLDARGVVHPVRDPFGRRLFGQDDIVAARERLRRTAPEGTLPAKAAT